MSDPHRCFPSNPDISGIGVRSAVYAQNILSLVPALFVLLNDGVVIKHELKTLETQSTTILITGFALLISAIVQAFNSDFESRLSNFHATIILNLSWMNNTNLFIYFVLYSCNSLEEWGLDYPSWSVREWWKNVMKKAKSNIVFIVGSAHLTLMAAVGIWFWRRPFSFGNAPLCSQSASVVFLGHQVSLTSEGLRGWSLFIYSLLLVPFVNLVVPVAFFSTPFFIWSCITGHPDQKRNHQVAPAVFGLVVLAVVNIIFLVNTEVTLQENKHLVDEGDADWTFGQTLALLLLLVPLRDIGETFAQGEPKELGDKLINASCKGELRLVEFIYGLGVGSRMIDRSLLAAASHGYPDIVRFLLEKDADVKAKDQDDRTPLMCAAMGGHSGTVRLLLGGDAGVGARDKGGWTPLMCAAMGGHDDTVQLLLEKGAELEDKDQGGRTPLMRAAMGGHDDTVRLLLEKGAELEDKDKGDQTPLMWAARYGHNDTVRLLLKKGAKLKAKDKGDRTLLMGAAEGGHNGTVLLLLEKDADADVKAKDEDDWTPLMWAAIGRHNDTVRLLLGKGADVEAKDTGNKTALMWAIESGYSDTARILEAPQIPPLNVESAAFP